MEKQDTEITKVVFRKVKDGEIIALFPYIKETKYFCLTYSHIGQHSGASYNFIIGKSKQANEAEYKELYNELTKSIGYNLDVIKRANYKKMYQA